ncbi:MAG: DUF4170 domain-containing protein [Alphaproteobacteria bacterium]|nr:DUF4170 domain-containing protein [Alphaproteobacteria bacterium]
MVATEKYIYWVVGGVYKDNNLTSPLNQEEEWIGPFKDYETAKKEWSKLAWNSVDNALARYRIEKLEDKEK